MIRFYLIPCIVLFFAAAGVAQLSIPRESQRQEIIQTVGDTRISIVYHRPNAKARAIWGCETKEMIPVGNNRYPCLVPYGQVWRAGANENTTIEFTQDVTINGQPLPAGKYGFHIIPNKANWTLIFNKASDKWGSFTYDQAMDALRVSVVPIKDRGSRETLAYEFDDVTANTTKVVLGWEKLRVPFTVGIGDVEGRVLAQIADAISKRKADDPRPLNQGANYVFTYKVKDKYDDALGWLDTSLGIRETFGTLVTKARLLEQAGRTAEAIAVGEKAILVGKAGKPPAPTAEIEKYVSEWKAKKS
jgi:hypothetical protein